MQGSDWSTIIQQSFFAQSWNKMCLMFVHGLYGVLSSVKLGMDLLGD